MRAALTNRDKRAGAAGASPTGLVGPLGTIAVSGSEGAGAAANSTGINGGRPPAAVAAAYQETAQSQQEPPAVGGGFFSFF